MNKNKKGFTLTELLVVVVILGIIIGLSIPLIRNLSSNFDKKKYQNYMDSVLVAAKLYNNSYSMDLFGNNEYGCAYITYDNLVEKELLKDIQMDKVSCNSDSTFVRVIKMNDKYYYSPYLGCGVKSKDKVTNIKVSLPDSDEVYTINNVACTGSERNNLSITADLSQTDINIEGNPFNKKQKSTRLTITSGTGINNNIVIYTGWSESTDPNTVTKWTKAKFKVKGNQEEQLENGEIISTRSSEISTGNLTGKYYLIVRVDNLTDLHGSDWFNPDNSNSKYLNFGVFSVDNQDPVITANAYVCGSDNKISGDLLKSESSDVSKVLNLFDVPGNINEWVSNYSFPNGICIDYNISDIGAIGESLYQENETHLALNSNNYKELKTSGLRKIYTGTKQLENYEVRINDDGHRYVRLTAKDIANNKSHMDVEVKIDKTLPVCNWSGESTSWTKSPRTITVTGSESDNIGSGIDDNYKTNKWVYDSGTVKTASPSYTIKDLAGNEKVCSKNVNVYFDLEPPTCSWSGESTSWTNSTRTITVTGVDTGQIDNNYKSKSWSYSTGVTEKANLSYTVKDMAGNETLCSKVVNVYFDKNQPNCGSINKTGSGTNGVSGTVSCSDGNSGCATVSFNNLKSTSNVTIRDGAGNTRNCSVSVESYNCNQHSVAYNCPYQVSWDCSYQESYTYQCNPYQCNPSQCNPHSCNAHSCNCYKGQDCKDTPKGRVCSTVTRCSTCYDTCYDTCYQTCYQTCTGTRTVPNTCYGWQDKTCWRDEWDTCYR